MTGMRASAQKPEKTIMAGIRAGPMLFFGDIGSMGTGYHAAISGSYAFSEVLSLRLAFDYGVVSDSDEGTPNAARDYAYTTVIIEPEVTVMYEFFTQRGKGFTRKGMVKQWDKWTGLVFAGIAFPWYKVTPGRHLTPAIMDRERGIAPALSAGAALQYGLSAKWYVRLTFNPHFVLSDYLDGYTSPNSTSYDIYHRVSLGLYYYLGL
ncbi:MAG: hypothetical protein GXO83_01670 [Chlorobi bacterium]|nr:hypothetical protein [Chlorobiota bacterium]